MKTVLTPKTSVEDENLTPSGKNSQGKKRKRDAQSKEVSATMMDVEMQDSLEEEETAASVARSTRRSLHGSLSAAAAAATVAVVTLDQSCEAVPLTAHVALSPLKPHRKDASTQSAQVIYDKEYVDFLEKSHGQAMQAMQEEMIEQQNRNARLREQLRRLEVELKKEKERSNHERGWNKFF